MLDVGTRAPDFALEDHDGVTHRLSQYRGRWLVLYFYPKDDTSGCTKEACGFRDELPAFGTLNAVVLGVSADDAESHTAFASKYDLNFPLLVDSDKVVLQAYRAYGEKTSFGQSKMGVFRVTYLIDPEGKIAHVWPSVKVEGHVEEVRETLSGLASSVGKASPAGA